MNDPITKKDLEELAGTIISAMDFKFQKLEGRMDEFDRKLDRLTTTLDNFVKQMSDYKEEFILLKGEVDKIKSFIKEKFGVEIAIQH